MEYLPLKVGQSYMWKRLNSDYDYATTIKIIKRYGDYFIGQQQHGSEYLFDKNGVCLAFSDEKKLPSFSIVIERIKTKVIVDFINIYKDGSLSKWTLPGPILFDDWKYLVRTDRKFESIEIMNGKELREYLASL